MEFIFITFIYRTFQTKISQTFATIIKTVHQRRVKILNLKSLISGSMQDILLYRIWNIESQIKLQISKNTKLGIFLRTNTKN